MALVTREIKNGALQHMRQGRYFRLISADSPVKVTFVDMNQTPWQTVVKVGMQIPMDEMQRGIYIESDDAQLVEFWWGKTPLDHSVMSSTGATGIKNKKVIAKPGETRLSDPSTVRQSITVKPSTDIFIGGLGSLESGWPVPADTEFSLPLAGSLYAYKRPVDLSKLNASANGTYTAVTSEPDLKSGGGFGLVGAFWANDDHLIATYAEVFKRIGSIDDKGFNYSLTLDMEAKKVTLIQSNIDGTTIDAFIYDKNGLVDSVNYPKHGNIDDRSVYRNGIMFQGDGGQDVTLVDGNGLIGSYPRADNFENRVPRFSTFINDKPAVVTDYDIWVFSGGVWVKRYAHGAQMGLQLNMAYSCISAANSIVINSDNAKVYVFTEDNEADDFSVVEIITSADMQNHAIYFDGEVILNPDKGGNLWLLNPADQSKTKLTDVNGGGTQGSGWAYNFDTGELLTPVDYWANKDFYVWNIPELLNAGSYEVRVMEFTA